MTKAINPRSKSSSNAGAGCLLFLLIIFLIWKFGPWSNSKDKAIQQMEELNKAQQEQIKTLQKSQKALEDLVIFIEKEKSQSENTAKKIKEDIQNLRAIQEVDQKNVDAIFSEQDKRKEQNIWKEWITAFVIGVLSSIAFQLIWNFISKQRRNKLENSES